MHMKTDKKSCYN